MQVKIYVSKGCKTCQKVIDYLINRGYEVDINYLKESSEYEPIIKFEDITVKGFDIDLLNIALMEADD